MPKTLCTLKTIGSTNNPYFLLTLAGPCDLFIKSIRALSLLRQLLLGSKEKANCLVLLLLLLFQLRIWYQGCKGLRGSARERAQKGLECIKIEQTACSSFFFPVKFGNPLIWSLCTTFDRNQFVILIIVKKKTTIHW